MATKEMEEFAEYWSLDLAEKYRAEGKSNTLRLLQSGEATPHLNAAWEAWKARGKKIAQQELDAPKVLFDAALLEAIDLNAEAGLCQMTYGGTRAFLKDIREVIKEARAATNGD